ncbi:MAG: type II toxin-antitoxin system Phd/YefM family antitoxin [Campylobacteraceae bacterium]|jgi:PHD/YefM family antitoxin component YafN of YafNO toxin-antitoxin module|nr:type II toxin-antitoxin system Phd/YefM family antitoxin [Campylobacteraceae bacterium]
MAIFYEKNEIFTATEMVRDFSSVLTKIGSRELERAVIVKNNRFRAVVVRIEEYEKMKEAMKVLESVYAKNKTSK